MGSNVPASAHIPLFPVVVLRQYVTWTKCMGSPCPRPWFCATANGGKKKFPLSSLLRDEQGNTNEEDQLRGDKTCEQPKQMAEKHQGEPSPLKGRGDAMSRKSISVPGGRRPMDYKHVPREASKTHPWRSQRITHPVKIAVWSLSTQKTD